MNITVIGTGNVGQKLGGLLIQAGHNVAFGSRSLDDVHLSVDATVLDVKSAISIGEIVFFAVPYSAYEALLPTLALDLSGKVVVDVSNPLNADWSPLNLGSDTSAGEVVSKLLPNSYVVKAFNTIFADTLTAQGLNRKGSKVTAFIAGNDKQAVETIKKLASEMGAAPVVAGKIENSRYFEAMAHLNIQLAVAQGGGTDAAFVYSQG